MEHLSELGRLGLGSRMKRFSDHLMSEVNAIYKQSGIDFEASGFPLLTLLERYGAMTLREAEQNLGTSHSYVSQKAKYLKEEKLIEIQASSKDARNKHMSLTAKGAALIEQVRPYWKAMDIAMARMLGDDEREIFQALTKLEDRLMKSRLLRNEVFLDQNKAEEIEIIDYTPAYKQKFTDLNLEWLEKSFTLKTFDKQVFADPQKYLIDKGGEIFFAILNGKPVGTGAIYPEDNHFELCKMGVDPRFRGKGIGRDLVLAGIERAKKRGADKITLTSNRHKLAPAVRLYRDMGFVEVPMKSEDLKKYGEDRINIRMEKLLA